MNFQVQSTDWKFYISLQTAAFIWDETRFSNLLQNFSLNFLEYFFYMMGKHDEFRRIDVVNDKQYRRLCWKSIIYAWERLSFDSS